MAKIEAMATLGGMQIAMLCPLGADLLRNCLAKLIIVGHCHGIPKQILLDLGSLR